MNHISVYIDQLLTAIEVTDEQGRTIKPSGCRDFMVGESELQATAQTDETLGQSENSIF